MARKRAPYWLCRCGTRNESRLRKCGGEGCNRSKPKRRVPEHAKTLRDDSYEVYNELNAKIHGVPDESCGLCGRPRSQAKRHDRDHGHNKDEVTFGKPRGLLCSLCNQLLPRQLSLAYLRLQLAYLERAETYYLKEAA